MSLYDELYDKRVANEFHYQTATHTQLPDVSHGDYAWVERFIAYSERAQEYFHWFVRF